MPTISSATVGSSNKSQVLDLLSNFAKPCLDMNHDQMSSESVGKHWLLMLEVGVSHFTMQAPKVCMTGAPKTIARISLVIIVGNYVHLANGKSRSR